MATLYFTKYFTKGVLKGITYHGKLTFVSVERAAEWLSAVRSKGERGKLPYRIIDASFQNYVRN